MPDGRAQIVVDIVSGSGGTSKVRSEMNKVSDAAKAINRETQQQAKQTERVLKDSAKNIVDFEIREEKRKERARQQAHKDYLAQLKAAEQQSKASAQASTRYWDSAFKGGIIGGFVGYFTAQFSQIPFIVKQNLDEAVKIAAERQNALKGLESMSLFKGINPADSEAAVKNLRLVKAGIVEIGDATTGLKNLLSSGFSLPESIKLLETFSDTAAFGKSSALSFGDAIRSATEGIRNGNSILVDNVGLTKNLSLIIKEAGFAEQDLMRVKDDVNVRMALFNGLVREALPQVGDADKLMVSWTGTTAALAMAQDNLLAAIGGIIIQNPALQAAILTTTHNLNGLTGQITDTESAWSQAIDSMTTTFAGFVLDVNIGVKKEIADLKELVRTAEVAANAIAYAFWVAANPISSAANEPFKQITGSDLPVWLDPFGEGRRSTYGNMSSAYSQMGTDAKAAAEYEKQQRDDYNQNLQNIKLAEARKAGFRGWKSSSGQTVIGMNDVKAEVAADAAKAALNAKHIKEYQQQIADLERLKVSASGKELKVIVSQIEKRKKIVAALEKGVGVEAARASTTGGGRTAAPGGGEPAMRRFFEEELGFNVNRTFGKAMNKGSLHPLGKAIDVDHSRIGSDELVRRIALAIQKGYQFVDERVKRKGIDQTGPHLHFEKDPNQRSSFLSAKFYGGEDRLAYLKAIDAKRLGKGGGTSGSLMEDIGKTLSEQSEMLTEADRVAHIRRIIEIYKMTGVIPTGKLLDDIHKLMVEDVKKTGASTYGMNEQRTAMGFSRGGPDGLVTYTGTVSDNIVGRPMQLSVEEQYIKDLRVRLGLEAASTDEISRGAMLLVRKAVKEKEIETLLEDQRVTRGEMTHDLEIQLELLRRGNIVEEARVRALENRVYISREIRDLQIEIMNAGMNDQLVIEAARLRDILELRNRERDAVIEINRAQLELSKAMEISNNQIRAGIYGHMAAQKTLNQGIVDGINGTYDAILARMNEPLDKLNEKSKGLLSFITEPLKAMQAQGLNRIWTGVVDRLFPGDSPIKDALKSTGNPVLDESKKQTDLLTQIRDNTGGVGRISGPTGGPGFGGGKLQNLMQMIGLGGGGMGPAGTPPFFPSNNFNGPGAGSGGVGEGDMSGTISGTVSGPGRWGGIFDPQKNPITGKENSQTAGVMGGIGSIASMAGGMIGGKWGNVLSLAGTGMQMGAMFGPWGAAIGAAAGAGIGLFMALRGDGAIKKLKEAAASQFGISVKDKAVLNSLKVLGEGMFGKGKVGENAVAVVRSEEGMNILRAYAETSGQSGLKIDRLNYGDPNWEGNNFRSQFGGFRATGGRVRAGYNYMVGERGPEMVRFARDAQVVPNDQLGGGGIDRTLVASLAESVYQLADEVKQFKTMPAGALVKAGLDENPGAAADAVEREYGNDGRRAEKQFRNLGQMV